MAKIWRETELRGEIKSQRVLSFGESRRALRSDQIQVLLSEELILEMLEEGSFDEKEADKAREVGTVDDLILDSEGDVTEIKTSEGLFLLISQSVDGHGNLLIVEEMALGPTVSNVEP